MLSRLVAMLCLTLLASFSVAQENTPPITAENATQLVPVQTVGSALPGKLSFSPDGRYILTSTSEQTFVYQSEQPDAAPKILPFTNFNFDSEDRLIADGQYWNLATGLSVGIAPTIRVLPSTENQPDNLIEVVKPGGETIRVDTGFPDQVIGTAVSDDYSILAVVMQRIEQDFPRISLYLYHISTGELYTVLPQKVYGNLNRLFFINGSTTLISEFYAGMVPLAYITVYEAETGNLLFDYSGESEAVGQLSPDSGLFAYILTQNQLVFLGHELFFQIPYNASSPYAIGNQHLAIFEENEIKVIDLRDQAAKSISLVFEETISTSDFYFAQDDRWLVSNFSPLSYVWDLQRPETAPIAIESDEGFVQDFNQDFTRYTVRVSLDAGYKYVVHDLASGEMLADLPSNVILNAAMSQAVYWQNGTVMLRDIGRDETLPLHVIENYRGRVLAFNEVAGVAAFASQQLTLIQVPDAIVLPVEISPAPYSVDFTADGERVLINRGFQGEDGTPAYVAILETRSGAEIADLTDENSYRFRVVSPSGHYILDDYAAGAGCRGLYSFPGASLFLAQPDSGDDPQVFVDGACDKNTMAFTRDDRVFYAGAYSNVFAFQPDAINEPVALLYGDVDSEFSILNYTSPGDYPEIYDVVRGVVLSPDQRRLAVIVDRSRDGYNPLQMRTEIFDIAQLKPGTQRIDIPLLSTIPGATIANFSPDGNSIVTNVGLFSVKFTIGAKAIDGTISAFTSDSQLLATYQDGYVNLWDVNNPSHITFPLAQYAIDGVKELAFSPDNRYLYIVRVGDVQMWGVK